MSIGAKKHKPLDDQTGCKQAHSSARLSKLLYTVYVHNHGKYCRSQLKQEVGQRRKLGNTLCISFQMHFSTYNSK